MEIYHFNDSAKRMTEFGSGFLISRILNTESPVHIVCMQLETGGVIGYHQAVVPQLLLVIDGEGTVRGKEDNSMIVQKGQVVFWDEGEWHETRSDKGLTAIVIEGEKLNPSKYMSNL